MNILTNQQLENIVCQNEVYLHIEFNQIFTNNEECNDLIPIKSAYSYLIQLQNNPKVIDIKLYFITETHKFHKEPCPNEKIFNDQLLARLKEYEK